MLARSGKTGRQKTNAGFTLVEVAIGIGLLGVMMAAFYAGLGTGFATINTARQDLRATQILTQRTEAVRLCTWSQLQTLPTAFTDYYYNINTTNSTPSVTYYGTISVGPPTNCIPSSASYYTNIDLVTISVAWTNSYGAHLIAHSRQMQTLVAYHGLVNYLFGVNFTQQ